MASSKKIQIRQLDEKLKPFVDAVDLVAPERGWINAIRNTINISEEQFSDRLKLNRGGIFSLERSEKDGTISIDTLSEVAEALEMKLVYAIIPKSGNLDSFITKKAMKVAEGIVLDSDPSIKLNHEGFYTAEVTESIEALAQDIKRELRKSLWE